MVLFWIGAICFILLASFTLWRVSVDYKQGAELSPTTVAFIWLLYVAHLALVLFAANQQYFPIRVAEGVFIILGTVLVFFGTLLYILGLLHLGSIRRMSGVDTSRLITGGIYSWSRNPQNVGWMLFLFGIGLISLYYSQRFSPYIFQWKKIISNQSTAISTKIIEREVIDILDRHSNLNILCGSSFFRWIVSRRKDDHPYFQRLYL
jgi:protein-S-isoprenylcysteine O-methyltransferase Ste14